MAGKRWPSTGYLPGMSPFPDGARMPVKRKPRKRSVPIGAQYSLTGSHPTVRDLADAARAERLIIDDPHEHRPAVDRREALAWFAETFPREPGRPVTYDHPLALAARAGRKHALWSGPVPVFATAEERRAFEVGRARKLAWRRGER